MGFFQKFTAFMQGRYGMDALNGFLLVLAGLMWLANIFVWGFVPSLVLWLLEAAFIGLAVFRSLSRNINMRSLENRRFRKVYDPVAKWVKFQIRKFKERKDYKYLKCPSCKAQLRVKNQKGEHGVRCPKCRYEFRVKI